MGRSTKGKRLHDTLISGDRDGYADAARDLFLTFHAPRVSLPEPMGERRAQ